MQTLFVLDDDEDISFIIEVWFRRKEIEVTSFTNPQALFEKLTEEFPDVILLDVLIRGVNCNGLDVCRQLRRVYHFTNKIFLYSASPLLREEYKVCGANGFIDKPFELENLDVALTS